MSEVRFAPSTHAGLSGVRRRPLLVHRGTARAARLSRHSPPESTPAASYLM